MNLNAKLSLVGCICIALLSYPTSTAYGQTGACCLPNNTCQTATALSCAIDLSGTPMGAGSACQGDSNSDGFDDLCVAAPGQEACCLPNGSCQNATVLSCTIDLAGTPQGAGSACQGDNNGDGFDDLCVSPILISEYYEADGGTRKCIELFNRGTVDFDLGANGYRIADYTFAGTVTNRVTDARGIYTFGTLGTEVVPAGGVFVICAVDNGDGIPFDILLPFTCAPCAFTGGGDSPIASFNGEDEVVLFGPDISTPLDNVIDVFGVPGQDVNGPRSFGSGGSANGPYTHAAWERKFSVTRGVSDFNGFDACDFDGEKNTVLLDPPPFTPAGDPACLAQADAPHAKEWLFEGRNEGGVIDKHTLGSHVPDSAPIASNIQAITKLNTDVQLTLDVVEIDGDPFEIIVDPLPSVGTLWDGPATTGVNINVAGVPYTMTTSFVTFVPVAGVGTDTSFNYHGRQTSPVVQSGNTATASILVEDESVIITEVLYDPNSAQPESQWEYVEIINTTGSTISLGEINNTNCPVCDDNLLLNGAGGAPTNIGPGEILVIVGNITTNNPRIDQEFLNLWGLTASQVLFVDSTNGNFPFLAQAGTQLFLMDDTGDLLDFVPNYGNAPFPTNDAGSSILLTSTDKDNGDGANWANAVVDCENGIRQVSDGSIGSPGVVPGGTGVLSPCATGGMVFTQIGVPTTTKTVTLQGTLGGNAPAGATLGFRITKLPFVIGNGADVTVGELHDGPTAGGTVLSVGDVVADVDGKVTLTQGTVMSPATIRHFINFEFKAVEKLVGGPPDIGEESPAARQIIAVQGNSLVITEIMANPANTSGGNETYWEYLEIHNTSGSPVILGSMQSTNDPASNNLEKINGSTGVTIPGGASRIIARDALDGATVRTRAEFEAEWSTASPALDSTNVIYVPNLSSPGGNQWDGFTNSPSTPGRFVTIWDNSNNFELDGLLDVVVYQFGQNGWPANSQPNSIFYRGDANGAPFTTDGNDLAASWQESTPGCPGDGSFDSFADIIGGDTTVDHGSPLALPTNPDECVPTTCATCVGDIDGDGFLTGGDIQGFIDVAIAPGFPLVACADMNGDGNALDYLPDVTLFVDALVFGSTDCLDFEITHTTDITISLIGAPVAGDIELFIGGCDPALACDTLIASPPFICFERVTVMPATTAVQLAEELAFGLDRTKGTIGGLDEFCAFGGADVSVTGSTISIVFTRAAGLPVPCCYLQDTDGRFSIVPPFDFVLLGGANNCTVSNLLNGATFPPADEGDAHTSGFGFTKTGE